MLVEDSPEAGCHDVAFTWQQSDPEIACHDVLVRLIGVTDHAYDD